MIDDKSSFFCDSEQVNSSNSQNRFESVDFKYLCELIQ
jgi:hypothetical protein